MNMNHPLIVEPVSNRRSDRPGKLFRCFSPSRGRQTAMRTWFTQWGDNFSSTPLALTTAHQDALARLVPALLCGEQSAIEIFQTEAEYLAHKARNSSLMLFHTIENDEAAHEASLQMLRAKLPIAVDENVIRRRSQGYFAGLGRAKTVAHRFGQVAQLDSAVCAIMWFVQHSEVGGNSMVGKLAERIKRDEARHVSVSRQHAFALGLSRDDYCHLGERVRCDLTSMLEYVANSFEDIGIDADLLFARIRRGTL